MTREKVLKALEGAMIAPKLSECVDKFVADTTGQFDLLDWPDRSCGISPTELAMTYTGRLYHLRKKRIPCGGFAETIEELKACESAIKMMIVKGSQFHWVLLFLPDLSRLIGCLFVSIKEEA